MGGRSSSREKRKMYLPAVRGSSRADGRRISRHTLPLSVVLLGLLAVGCTLAVILMSGVPGDARVRGAGAGKAAPVTVCLDPGHSVGGPSSIIDPESGLDVADCPGGPGEIRAAWELALKVKAGLVGAGYEVRLTKKSIDSCVDLKTRAEIGNTCSIMVRLHSDTSFKVLLHPAVGQFKAHEGKRVDVDHTVARLSTKLALAMFPFLEEVGIPKVMEEMGGHTDNTGSAYVVSALSRVPVVLIENDPLILKSGAGRDKVAGAIVKGIDAYFRDTDVDAVSSNLQKH